MMDDASQFGRFDEDDMDVTVPDVGTDERRMHVRAYNYWVSLLDGRAYPSIEDLDPSNLDDFGPNSVLLDFTGGPENPTIAFLGGALRRECNLAPEITCVDEVPSRSLLSRLTDHYLQIIANRAPVGFEAEFVNERGNNTMYRGILMPFSSDDDTIDFIYGVINWKEVADPTTAASLSDEVERVLQASPVRHDAPVNIWADGPSAEVVTPPPANDVEDGLPAEPDHAPETLGDWLHVARESAEAATHADARSRQSLYRALSLAYDFALVADARPEEYAELLGDSGIVAHPRAPMTPIVKLVFGAGYDKTRLAEYGIALAHGRRVGVQVGEFQRLIETHPGGLKGLVYAERAERRPARPDATPAVDRARERARKLQGSTIIAVPGEEEFVILLARRVDGDHVTLLGAVADDATLVQKAIKSVTAKA